MLYHTQKSTQNGLDQTVRPEIIKFLEEDIRFKLLDISLGNDFLDLTPNAKATKAKISSWDYIKLKAAKKTTK